MSESKIMDLVFSFFSSILFDFLFLFYLLDLGLEVNMMSKTVT